MLSGAIITSRIWESATQHSVDDIQAVDFAYAILLWVYLLVCPKNALHSAWLKQEDRAYGLKQEYLWHHRASFKIHQLSRDAILSM